MKDAVPFEFAKRIPGLTALTTTRTHNLGMNTDAPASEVLAARKALWNGLGLPLEQSVFLQQVHGDGLKIVGRESGGLGMAAWDQGLADCDLVLAKESGVLLGIGHADCLAVLLADPLKRTCAAGHAGWRGAALHVPAKLVRAMKEQGSDPEDLQAGLSVCLGPCHLELGEELHGKFSGRPGAGPLDHGRFMLDLRALAREDLLAEGLLPEKIEAQEACTWCEVGTYFSHRAEKGKAGRQMSLIGFVP